MALLWLDSFDHYATAQIPSKWTATNGSPGISATSRFGTGALGVDSTEHVQRTITSSAGPYIFGFAFRYTATPAADTIIFTVLEGTTTHVDLRLTPSGLLRVTRAGTSLGLGSRPLSRNSFYYIELKVSINDTTGIAVVRLNNLTEINLSGQDTQNGGTGVIDNYRLGYNGSGQASDPAYYDDHAVLDTTGSAPTNDFIGDIRVETILPSGNGNSSQLVGSDGNSTDNYLLVDEATPNDADYVESSTVGDKDTYVYGNVTPTTGTVFGVQPVPRAAKTDAGARSIVSVARLSGVETDGPAQSLTTTALYYPDVRETKPGGGAWTITDVNNAEFGAKINA